jgi:hypothetical protein
MCCRFATPILVVLLGVLLGLNTMLPAAPLPDSAKTPAISALVYVGLGKNDPDNAKRIDKAIADLRSYGSSSAVRDPKVKALRIVREKDPIVALGSIERDKWAESNTRVANLDGTAVVRVWFTDGSPEEQVLIVNAIARAYVEYQQDLARRALPELEKDKARFKVQQESAGVRVTEKDEREFRRQEEALRHPPHVIEWASLPERP